MISCLLGINFLHSQSDNEKKKKETGNLFKNVWEDEKEIWSSPFRFKSEDLMFWVPVVATTAILITNDEAIYRDVNEFKSKNQWAKDVSSQITKLGDGGFNLALSGLFFLGGSIFNDEKAKEVASLSLQVLIHTGIVVQVGKHLTGRARPKATNGVDNWSGLSGFFKRYDEGFSNYDAFPSGHTITAWGMATVIAEEYKHKPIIPIISYTLATAAGLSRVIENEHWFSDVFVGAALGYIIAKYIIKKRSKNFIISPSVSGRAVTLNINYIF